tara:strand:- start:6304 stop:6495 length:192 start_codon:yes stop_codon:yes gene_type:complete
MSNKAKLVTMAAAVAVVLGTGCSATTTVGPSANPPWVDASVNKDGVNVTLPFVKAGVAPVKED